MLDEVARSEFPPPFMWSQLGPLPVELTDSIIGVDGDALAGDAGVYDRMIRLDSGVPVQAMRVHLYHEWLHIVLHDAGFTQDHIEEIPVQAIATALAANDEFHFNGGVPEDA